MKNKIGHGAVSAIKPNTRLPIPKSFLGINIAEKESAIEHSLDINWFYFIFLHKLYSSI